MEEMWSGDRAALTKVVELHESNGEYLEPQRVLDAFSTEQRDAVLQSLRRLNDNGYINAVTTPAMGQRGPQLDIAFDIRGQRLIRYRQIRDLELKLKSDLAEIIE